MAKRLHILPALAPTGDLILIWALLPASGFFAAVFKAVVTNLSESPYKKGQNQFIVPL